MRVPYAAYKSIDGNLYSKDSKTFIQYAIGKANKTFSVPETVTDIGNFSFAYCGSLTSVTIPDSVTSIGEKAFSDCCSLIYNEYDNGYYLGNETNPYVILVKAKNEEITSCNIHKNTKIIADEAFYNCTDMKNILIPDSIIHIGYGIFGNCDNLQYNEYDNGYYLGNETNSYVVFVKAKNKEITSCDIHADTRFIHSNAFYYCNKLKSVVIGDSVMCIVDYMFYGCSALTTVEISDSVTSIGTGAFLNCSSLKSIVIPDSVTSIGNSAFYNCSNLASVVIPYNVTIIEDHIFAGCSSLTSIEIPDSITSIGYGAFAGCTSLKSIVIPNSVRSIDGWIFGNNTLIRAEYKGTKAEWEKIIKAADIENYVIHCMDGDIYK